MIGSLVLENHRMDQNAMDSHDSVVIHQFPDPLSIFRDAPLNKDNPHFHDLLYLLVFHKFFSSRGLMVKLC